ncbi:MAG: hypothetical protein Kow00121_18310 [Elainellaceae cyanobacterium]
MLNVAIVGANGFIGSRAVEMFHLNEWATVRPIVRHVPSLARLSRFNLDSRVADALDQTALRDAFLGCDVVVHAVAGDRQTILETLAPTYWAAQEAGVKRLIYLSSAAVHSQAPAVGTDENSPLSDRQPIAYNNAKVQAEQKLRQLRSQGKVELVMLRPGIVFGPRSYWLTSFADQLLAGQAYLVNGGKGICNSIYVDNLVYAIYLATIAPGVDQEAFIVGDDEQLTWAEFYQPIAAALGFDFSAIHPVAYTPKSASLEEQIEAVLASKPSLAFLSLFPNSWRQAARAALSTFFQDSQVSPWSFPQAAEVPEPIATLEMALLHQCPYKLPDTKARRVFNYQPLVSFPEACCRSIGWLAFAGYPVVDSDSSHCSIQVGDMGLPNPDLIRLHDN